jgi:hypothetical protein
MDWGRKRSSQFRVKTAKAVFLLDIMGWNIPVASRNPPEFQNDGSKARIAAKTT